MKRILILILYISSFLLIFTGCHRTKENINNNIGQSEEIQNHIDYEDYNNWILLDKAYHGAYEDIVDDLPIPDIYNGKSRKQWGDYSISINKVDNEFIQWAANGLLSPNGELAVYNSNKNTLVDGGMSIFLLDMKTGEEKVLVESIEGAYNYNLWWIDNSRIVYSDFKKDGTNNILISNIQGEKFAINSDDVEFNIVAFKENYLMYLTVLGVENEVKIASINRDNNLIEISTLKLEKGFFNGRGAISSDLSKAMLLVRDSYELADRKIIVWDFKKDKVYEMPNPINQEGRLDAITVFWDGVYPTVDFLVTKGETSHNELWEYKYDKK